MTALPKTALSTTNTPSLPVLCGSEIQQTGHHAVSATSPVADEVTDDSLFAGRLICRQHRNGYRFSVDAVLVAHSSVPKKGQRVLDLGCGCGVISLILAYRHPHILVDGLEVQAELADLATANIRQNGYEQRCAILRGDLRAPGSVLRPESYDLVVSNPPYRQQHTGRLNQNRQAASARHELRGNINDFARASAFAVKNRGKVVFIYPARRCNALFAALHNHRLTPKRLQPVYSHPQAANACLIVVEAVKNGGEQLELLAPFFIYTGRDSTYSAAMQALYEET